MTGTPPLSMDFNKEPYVRIYTTVSPTGRTYGFFGRCLMDQLVKHADRAGIIDLPERLIGDLPTAVASVIGCDDVDWVREYLPKLMDGPAPSVVLMQECYLVLPRYIEAQYSSVDTAFSARASRKKTADIKRAVELGLIEVPEEFREGKKSA